MASTHLTGRNSLRDIEATLQRQSHLRYHLGCQSVTRSSLSRANQTLSYRFYEQLFAALYKQCQTAAPEHRFRFKKKLFSLDSSLIDVSMKVFPHADFNRTKAAYKLHIGLDHDGLIPAFAVTTHSKLDDQVQAKLLRFPKDSVVVYDKGYNDYSWHNQLTSHGIFWVTRIRSNANYRVLEHCDVNKAQGITSDQTIEYSSRKAKARQLRPVRRIGYRDPKTGKHYAFITNHFNWSPKTITDIYKQRWQVELFFKWIKQNLKIKAFIGNTDNAVMTQIMVAVCVYLLLAYIKFQSKLSQSLQQILQLLHTNLFARRSLYELFKPPPDDQKLTPQILLLWSAWN